MYEENNIVVLIIRSFSEIITQEESSMIKKWISEDPQNLNYYRELMNIWQVSHPVFLPDDIDVARAEGKVMDHISQKRIINSKLYVIWQQVAAIMIIPITILLAYLFYQHPPHSTVIAFQEVASPFGMSSKIDLPDGSTAWLNSGTKLKYPVVFAEATRKVYLSGEAFFKVHSDKKHPFIVSTAKVDVKATGTEFNVEAYLADSITAVTLMKGKVNVNIFDNKKEQLQPNQRLVLNSISKKYTISQSDAHWGMWKDGILSFRDETLENVFKRIGRIYNVDITVKDPVVARQIYRATFNGESLDEILRLLKMSAPIKYRRIERIERIKRTKQSYNEYKKVELEVYRSN